MDGVGATIHNAQVMRLAQCYHETVAISTIKGNPQCRAFHTSLLAIESMRLSSTQRAARVRAGRREESSSEEVAIDDAAPEGAASPYVSVERSASRPSHPLPKDFNVLCPYFSLAEAEATTAELELPEIVQATFYAMLLNQMLELDVVHEYTVERMKSLLPDEVDVKAARDGQKEGSGSADPPAPSSDEE
ncbi:hypothetical protein Cgig2_013327 [Carnegiea gigantea]|uniref:Uncharacterized protein n=1 Tax=Carnegiea gigantea TaxID=171969 RepID=A0A9Q1GS75_9CARY|nr:hypothetical protein Cgig2_013327 [Carnegiea gigantea]